MGTLLLLKLVSLPRRISEGVSWLLKDAPAAILRAGNSAASAAWATALTGQQACDVLRLIMFCIVVMWFLH